MSFPFTFHQTDQFNFSCFTFFLFIFFLVRYTDKKLSFSVSLFSFKLKLIPLYYILFQNHTTTTDLDRQSADDHDRGVIIFLFYLFFLRSFYINFHLICTFNNKRKKKKSFSVFIRYDIGLGQLHAPVVEKIFTLMKII